MTGGPRDFTTLARYCHCTRKLAAPRVLVEDVEAMDRGPTTSARSSDLLITLVASAVVKRGDQCVAEDGQPAALSALLIGRPSGGESFAIYSDTCTHMFQ